MDGVIAVNNNFLFKENIRKAKEETYSRLISRMDDAKLTILKAYLKENNIIFDDRINNLQEFMKRVVNQFDSATKDEVNNIMSKSTMELQKLIDELKANSTSAFRRFLSNTYTGLIKPIGKGAAIGLASRTALILAPTIVSKLVIGAGILAHSTYKLIKTHKQQQIIDQNYECNRILQELETTKNSDGTIIDTRFNKDMQENIISFLKLNNINFENTGYLSLRECIYNMDLYERIALANVINNMTGNRIKVNERLSKYDRNFSAKLKSALKPIIGSAVLGETIATAVNSIDPSIIAAPINGVFLGTIVGKLANSPVAGWISGVVGGLGTTLSQYIPVIGTALENAYAIENIGALSAIGAVGGFSGLLVANTVRTIKNIGKKLDNTKDQKDISEKDSKLYAVSDEEEYERIKQNMANRKQSVEELAILGLINTFLREKGISVTGKISTIGELKAFIASSSREDKAELLDLIKSLDNYNKNNNNAFKKTLKKIGNTLCWTTTFGLAGLSVWDILSGGGILEGISGKMFHGVNGVLEKPSIVLDRTNPIKNGNPLPSSDDVATMPSTPTPQPTHVLEPTPTPQPTPAPAPAPAPTPTLNPANAIAGNPSNINGFSLFEIASNTRKFVDSLSTISPEKAYLAITKLENPGLIKYCVDNLPSEMLDKIVKFMNTSSNINTEAIGYKIIKHSINAKLLEIAKYVDAVRRNTSAVADAALPITTAIGARFDATQKKK